MKKIIIGLLLVVFVATGSLSGINVAMAKSKTPSAKVFKAPTIKSSPKIGAPKVKVNGYKKKNGTYVAPHYRTAPDNKKSNNWSTKGNINPVTGKKGTKKVK